MPPRTFSDRSGVIGQTSYTDPTTGQGTIAGAATAVLDLAKSQVRITSAVAAFAGRVTIKPGTSISAVNVLTGGIFQAPTGLVQPALRQRGHRGE